MSTSYNAVLKMDVCGLCYYKPRVYSRDIAGVGMAHDIKSTPLIFSDSDKVVLVS